MSFPRRGLPIFRFRHHVEIVLLSLLSGARISTELVQVRWLLALFYPVHSTVEPWEICWHRHVVKNLECAGNSYVTYIRHMIYTRLFWPWKCIPGGWILSTVVVAVTKRAKSALFSLSRAQIAISRKSANRSFPLFFNFFIWREQTRVFKSVKEDYTGLMGTV